MTWSRGPRFESFDSMEEAQEAMAQAERIANALVTSEQVAIGYGDYWCSAFDDFLIWGRVSTLEELDAESARLSNDPEEVRGEHDVIVSAHARGYRFGWCYSIVEPEGELGSTHISRMIPLDQRQFDKAKEHGWNVREVLGCPDCHYWITQVLLQVVVR
jgi:hypothetical protein